MTAAAAAVLAVVITGYAKAPIQILLGAAAILLAAAFWLESRRGLRAYVALLGVQVPLVQSVLVLRLAVADFFMAPAIARTAYEWLRGQWHRPRLTLDRPLLLLAVALVLGNAVAFVRLGSLTTYALVNKDLGFATLLAGAYVIASTLRTGTEVEQLIDRFVIGVSIANVCALMLALVSVAVVPNDVFLLSSRRLYGWMLNPNSYGNLVATTALLELARVGERRQTRLLTVIRAGNYGLLLTAVYLTLSRSAWVMLVIGAATILFAWAVTARRGLMVQRRRVAAAVATLVIPASMILWIANLNAARLESFQQQGIATSSLELRQTVIGWCVTSWDPELCEDLPPAVLEAARQRAKSAGPARAGRAGNSGSAATNASGLEDRLVILRRAWNEYSSSPASMLLGTGLGTFYATSARDFGVPLIIHHTLMWSLTELGLLGCAAMIWLLGRTLMNAYEVVRRPGEQQGLAVGLLAAIVAWIAYSMLNEASYLRHFWVLMVCADRLYVASGAPAFDWRRGPLPVSPT